MDSSIPSLGITNSNSRRKPRDYEAHYGRRAASPNVPTSASQDIAHNLFSVDRWLHPFHPIFTPSAIYYLLFKALVSRLRWKLEVEAIHKAVGFDEFSVDRHNRNVKRRQLETKSLCDCGYSGFGPGVKTCSIDQRADDCPEAFSDSPIQGVFTGLAKKAMLTRVPLAAMRSGANS